MKWEELKVYHPVPKEELKATFKEFSKLIAGDFVSEGFNLHGRRLIRVSDDMVHTIHIDTRGSWSGISEMFKIEISLGTVFDVDTFVTNNELTHSRKIEDFVPKIKDHYRVTREFPLLAASISDKLKQYVLPHFDKYRSSKDVIRFPENFKIDDHTEIFERNRNLVLFSELANHVNLSSSKILKERAARMQLQGANTDPVLQLISLLNNKEWEQIAILLDDNRKLVKKKLKIK